MIKCHIISWPSIEELLNGAQVKMPAFGTFKQAQTAQRAGSDAVQDEIDLNLDVEWSARRLMVWWKEPQQEINDEHTRKNQCTEQRKGATTNWD